jgi:hypothetical protein
LREFLGGARAFPVNLNQYNPFKLTD